MESGVGDVISSIESSGRKASEKRVPKYNVKGELVGYKVKPGGISEVKPSKTEEPVDTDAYAKAASTYSMQPKKIKRAIASGLKQKGYDVKKRDIHSRKGRKAIIEASLKESIKGAQDASEYTDWHAGNPFKEKW